MILFPIIVFLLFAAIQISIYFLAQSEAQGAAQAGLNAQRGYQPLPGAGKNAVAAYLSGRPGWFVPNGPGSPQPPPGTTQITFIIHGRAMSLVPGWHWKLTATATGPAEHLSAPGGP
ncbi:MAG TPA: TadE family protein [Micromonosporaceae bacterium]